MSPPVSPSFDERLAREKAFHNERFNEETREAQSKYYFALGQGEIEFEQRLCQSAKSADVLEYGCAYGRAQTYKKFDAKSITGIDISDVACERASADAQRQNVPNARFFVMNAEEMTFPDQAFDLVFGAGIIHHLDIARSMAEILRVLRPNGRAIFWEPLGHNPMINLYRKLTPHVRTEDEHPLLKRDFDIIEKGFSHIDLTYYGLFSLLAVPFRKTAVGPALRNVLFAIDRVIFSLGPMRWLGWYVLIDLQKKS